MNHVNLTHIQQTLTVQDEHFVAGAKTLGCNLHGVDNGPPLNFSINV